MRVLVSAASKYGATSEIGEAIAGVLRARGLDVTVAQPDDVRNIDWYDAIVLGSAVYMGQWLKPAKRLVARHREELASRTVWLFSSGPIGDPAMPKDEAVDIGDMVRVTAARGHRTFAGKLARADLSFPEKALVTALRAQEGDFRDWSDVEDWAAQIAEELMSPSPAWRLPAIDPAQREDGVTR
jgi:menaquinone-dependent protoporphyrinogen oxidase